MIPFIDFFPFNEIPLVARLRIIRRLNRDDRRSLSWCNKRYYNLIAESNDITLDSRVLFTRMNVELSSGYLQIAKTLDADSSEEDEIDYLESPQFRKLNVWSTKELLGLLEERRPNYLFQHIKLEVSDDLDEFQMLRDSCAKIAESLELEYTAYFLHNTDLFEKVLQSLITEPVVQKIWIASYSHNAQWQQQATEATDILRSYTETMKNVTVTTSLKSGCPYSFLILKTVVNDAITINVNFPESENHF